MKSGRRGNPGVVGFPPHHTDCFAFRLKRNGLAMTWREIFTELEKQYYVYIMTNHKNTVLYTGVTNDLRRRAYEHKNKLIEGFTKKYNLTRLVYYEPCDDIEGAITREKQIKAGSRQDKVELINTVNRDWYDLYNEL